MPFAVPVIIVSRIIAGMLGIVGLPSLFVIHTFKPFITFPFLRVVRSTARIPLVFTLLIPHIL